MRLRQHLLSRFIRTVFTASIVLLPAMRAAQKQSHIYLDRGSEQMLASKDVAFAIRAAQSTTAEIQLGQLAVKKADNPEVREFAQRLVSEYSQADGQLKQIAKQQNITLPGNMNSRHQAQYDKLQALAGSRFDQTYMGYMVSNQRADAKAFFKEGKEGKDPAIRNFAAHLLPRIEQNLAAAKSMHFQLIGGGS